MRYLPKHYVLPPCWFDIFAAATRFSRYAPRHHYAVTRVTRFDDGESLPVFITDDGGYR